MVKFYDLQAVTAMHGDEIIVPANTYIATILAITKNNLVPNVYHQFLIFCEHRDELQIFLKEKGIETLIHYPIPPHKQECYKEWNTRNYPITEKIHAQELSIPMNQVIMAEEAQAVVAALNSFKD